MRDEDKEKALGICRAKRTASLLTKASAGDNSKGGSGLTGYQNICGNFPRLHPRIRYNSRA
jgi:hypothetical protein